MPAIFSIFVLLSGGWGIKKFIFFYLKLKALLGLQEWNVGPVCYQITMENERRNSENF